MAKASICKIDGCVKSVHARSLCQKHYRRWQREHRDPSKGKGVTPGSRMKYFQDVVLPYRGDGCLIWPYARGKEGYGRIRYKGKTMLVHRLACILVNGQPAHDSMEAAHSCGKGHEGCCNPKHLRWATRSDNFSDKVHHGTDNRGVKHWKAKLSNEDVLKIRSMKGKVTQKALADQFGTTRDNISRIINNKRWKHLTY